MKPKSQYIRNFIACQRNLSNREAATPAPGAFCSLPCHLILALSLGLTVAGVTTQSSDAATWVGATSQDWNTASNWDSAPANPTGNFLINTTAAGQFPIINATSAFAPVDLIIGSNVGLSGRLDQTAGTAATGAGNWLILGADGTGTFNISGGSMTAQEVHMARTGGTGAAIVSVSGTGVLSSLGAFVVSDGTNNVATAVGTLNVNSGGTVNSENDFLVSFAGGNSTQGIVNIAAGATVNIGSSTKRWLIMNYWDSSHGQLNVNGGTLNLNANTDIRFATGWYGPGASNGQSSITLNGGAINGGDSAVIDLNNSADRAVDNSLNLNGGTLTISAIFSGKQTGNRVINFNGGTLRPSVSNAFFLTDSAVSSAKVLAGGAVINSNNFDITIAKPLVADTVSTGGGLTKNGLGKLTLSGISTYTGNTTVNAGSLAIDSTGGIKFVLGASNDVNNKLSGVAAVDGAFVVDISGASTVAGRYWHLVDTSSTGSVTYDVNFKLTDLSGNSWTLTSTPGVWIDGTNRYQYNQSTGVVTCVIVDTDGDGLSDEWEIATFGNLTTATITDTDGDGVLDSWEMATFGNLTTATVTDKDGDSLPDAWEIEKFTNITSQTGSGDADGDGATNLQEYVADTDPNSNTSWPDVDLDGLNDAWEIANFGNIVAQDGTGDPDHDYCTNLQEFTANKNPMNANSWPDSDLDGLNDGWEIANFGNLSTGNVDSDGDGASNAAEMAAGSNPNSAASKPDKAKLAHRWSFTSGDLSDTGTAATLSNATIVDAGANGVTINAALDGLTLVGGTKDTSDYISLGSNLLQGKMTPVTIELWATEESVKNWSRIFDLGSSNGEYLMMAWNRGTDANTDRVEWADTPAASATADNTNAPFALGTKYHIVMTVVPAFNSNGALTGGSQVTWYAAPAAASSLGAAKGTFNTANHLATLNDVNLWLGRSQWPDDTANATYDEVRIWDGALTANERESFQTAGPNSITVTDLDADADGLPDAWEIANFGSIGAQTGTGDADGDGTNNATEYRLGLNPNNGSSQFAASLNGNVIHWQGKAGLMFTVQRSTTLGNWTALTTNQAGVEGSNSYTDSAPPAGKAFYRVLLQP